MPATMLFDDHHRAQLAHRLNRSLDDTRNRARRAAEARRTNRQLDEEKNQLVGSNPNLASVDVHRKTMYIWFLLCMVAVYGMDLVLFAAVAGYFVKQSFAGSPRLATVAQFLVPAFIVVIEMGLSMQRDAAYRDYLEGFGSRLRLTDKGTKVALTFVLFHQRLCGPLANSLFHHQPDADARPKSKLEAAYHKADASLRNIIQLLEAA
jgi:hypothetical protein